MGRPRRDAPTTLTGLTHLPANLILVSVSVVDRFLLVNRKSRKIFAQELQAQCSFQRLIIMSR